MLLNQQILLSCVLATVLVAHSVPAWAVLIDSGNGNTSAPSDDPGWLNVGFLDTLNAVYVGYGWVMTASHVGISPGSEVILDGVSYSVQASSRLVIEHDATHEADLHVFRISPEPGSLPVLPIRLGTPLLNTAVTLIGRGWNQGTSSSWGGFAGPTPFQFRGRETRRTSLGSLPRSPGDIRRARPVVLQPIPQLRL